MFCAPCPSTSLPCRPPPALLTPPAAFSSTPACALSGHLAATACARAAGQPANHPRQRPAHAGVLARLKWPRAREGQCLPRRGCPQPPPDPSVAKAFPGRDEASAQDKADNPYFDERLEEKDREARKQRALRFHDKGHHVDIANKERARIKLEKLQQEIASAARHSGERAGDAPGSRHAPRAFGFGPPPRPTRSPSCLPPCLPRPPPPSPALPRPTPQASRPRRGWP